MSERKMTVSGLYRSGWSAAPSLQQPQPLLQLSGQWLAEEVGLYPGCPVRVLTEEGRLVVVVRGYEDAFGVES
jgi:hypothetical protein